MLLNWRNKLEAFSVFEQIIIRDFLKPFKVFTEAVSGCQSHLSLMHMTKHHIKKLTTWAPKDHQSIKELKLKILKNLYHKFSISTSITITSLLDPGVKEKLDITADEKFPLL